MRPKKSLGQHFLFDPRILDRIVEALEPQADDRVVEIGSGTGSLTERLALRVRHLTALEKDRGLAAALEERTRGSEWRGAVPKVVMGDALRLDWREAAGGEPFKVVGNIPYNLTTPLIDKALTAPKPMIVVLLVQWEVAARLVAAPATKEYGALSIGVQSVARVERRFKVAAGAFRPRPKVESAVVRLTPLEEPLVSPKDEAALRRFVTACFARRRKQIRTGLRAITGLDAATVDAGLLAEGVTPTDRPERLTPEQFVGLLFRFDRDLR